MSESQFIDVAGIAECSGRTIGTIRYWERLGQLPPSAKVGRRRVWKRADIQEHLTLCSLRRPAVNVDDRFFLNSESGQLEKIHGWARARVVAPWAVFFGVLLRVSARVPHYVQLQGVRGGRASLNLLSAFVGRSGDGKGAALKVAALAWPGDILTLPVGSGEGIAEMFIKKTDGEIEPIIFDIPEIDTLTGLAGAQGSILLPTLKSLAMGEQLVQANATKYSRRIVPKHSYRVCLAVSAQPGHAQVLFGDTTGGTPQRFLWAPVIDPTTPDGNSVDPRVSRSRRCRGLRRRTT